MNDNASPRFLASTLIAIECRPRVSLVQLRGEIDVTRIAMTKQVLQAASSRRNLKVVVISLLGVTYLDSALLHQLAAFCDSAAKATCQVFLVRPDIGSGQSALEMVGLPAGVLLFDTMQAALCAADRVLEVPLAG